MAERLCGVELVDRMRDVDSLARAERGDRLRELPIGDCVRRPRRDRNEAAGELVRALRPPSKRAILRSMQNSIAW
jgi:hypothetical protein